MARDILNIIEEKLSAPSEDVFVFPTSFAQQRMWFLDQLHSDAPLFNIILPARLKGRLNVGALEESLNEVVRRHEVLRTTFVILDDQPVQVIDPTLKLNLPMVDLSKLPESEREAQVSLLTLLDGRHGFDLARGPLLRATLLCLSDEEQVLLITMHHIIGDNWSVGVLVKELGVCYAAAVAGHRTPLPELRYQYADFAVWQRQWLQNEVLHTQLSYWKEQLGGRLQLLELPTDRPRPPLESSRGAARGLYFPDDLTEALKALSQQEGSTLFMTLLAAFLVLLSRYSGQDDIIVGTVIANRNRAEIEELIGFFVNTLVLRINLGGEPTFRELLGRVRQKALEAYAHQDLPYEMLIEALPLERDPSRNPLIQVIFQLDSAPIPPLELPGLTLVPLGNEVTAVQFDLTVRCVVSGPDKLQASLEYRTDLFEEATIARMASHWQALLQGIASNSEQRISDLPLLTDAERSRLASWNDTTVDYPLEARLDEQIQSCAERIPDAVVVVSGAQHLTRGALDRRSNQLAHYLRALGVGPEALVGLCVERSVEMVIGLLGILKAGGAYVPLDPTYPRERLAWMLEDAQVPLLLTQKRLLKELPEHGSQVICLDSDWDQIARQDESRPASSLVPENPAYVIYTSGSTGRSKGVIISHRAVCNHMFWMHSAFPVREQDGVLQKTPFSFDAAVWEFLASLISGARLIMARPAGHQEPDYLAGLIREEGATVVQLVPSLLRALLEEEGFRKCRSLKRVFCGGEALPVDLQDRFGSCLDSRLINLYGPAETSIDATFWICRQQTGQTRVPIGRPVANTQIYLLDRYQHPVPVGVSGELHIGGRGLGRGYLRRPDLTAERFIPNPFSDESGSRLYRTGDVARYLADGRIEFLGRIDHQVKVRGFRIEMGEIESVLQQHPMVRQTVVVVGNEGVNGERLIAYVVPERVQAPTTSRLRRYLKQKLPDYMIPSAFVLLEALPLTPSGKVDRRALPHPDGSRPELESALILPRTPTEQVLAHIWAEVLGVEQVGVFDNFFELGGDSILSIQIVSKVKRAGLQLTPRQIFECRTIAELAAVVTPAATSRLEQEIITGPLPLTPIQGWFFEQDFEAPDHFNQSVLLRVQQPMNGFLFEEALQKLVTHHDALRLRFRRRAAAWEQFHADLDEPVPFTQIDLAALTSEAQQLALEREMAKLQASLDIFQGPLLRMALFELGYDKPNDLIIIIHHLAMDAVSWRALLEDLHLACEQLLRGEPVMLYAKTTPYKQWAESLQKYSLSGALQREIGYWLPVDRRWPSPLPVDFVGGDNTVASTHTMTVSLNREETEALLSRVSVNYRVSIAEVMITSLAQAISRWTGQLSILIDLEGHGREAIFEDVDLSRTVGWFTVIFPLFLSLDQNADAKETLRSIKEQIRRVPNSGLGYGLLRYIRPEPETADRLSASPQPEIVFNYLGRLDQILPESSLFVPSDSPSGPSRSLRARRRHLLEINGGIRRGQLRVVWTYSQNSHSRTTIGRLAQDFLRGLRSLISQCESSEAFNYSPSDFPDVELTQEQLAKALVELESDR